MNIKDKIYVAGHNGLVGSSIKRRLERDGYNNIICRSSSELDLRRQDAVEIFERKGLIMFFWQLQRLGDCSQ